MRRLVVGSTGTRSLWYPRVVRGARVLVGTVQDARQAQAKLLKESSCHMRRGS